MDAMTALLLFAIITLSTLTFEILFTYGTKGFLYGFSANRQAVEKTGLARRIERVYGNQTESASYVVPVLAAAAIMGAEGTGVSLAALLIILGRAGFALSYYTGIPFIRVPFFALTTVSTLYIAFVLLMMNAA